tara:strand:+ start:779 stop:1153 length:375 start_codon:yes stop_codon:yes gene_type:complete
MNYSEAAMMVWKRKARFVEGYDPIDDVTDIIQKLFGDYDKNIKEGLRNQYKILKDLVVKENLIGLVLLGKNVEHFISEYVTYNNNIIELTVSTICTLLLNDYFTEEEIKQECYKTPNIEIYLNK